MKNLYGVDRVVDQEYCDKMSFIEYKVMKPTLKAFISSLVGTTLLPGNAYDKDVKKRVIHMFTEKYKPIFEEYFYWEAKHRNEKPFSPSIYECELKCLIHNKLKHVYHDHVHELFENEPEHQKQWRELKYKHIVWLCRVMQDECELGEYNSDVDEFLDLFIEAVEQDDIDVAKAICNELVDYYHRILVDNNKRLDTDYSHDDEVISSFTESVKNISDKEELLIKLKIFAKWFYEQTRFEEYW